jgi:hypothetical protein
VLSSCYYYFLTYFAQAFGNEPLRCRDRHRSQLPLAVVNGSQASSRSIAATMTFTSDQPKVSLAMTEGSSSHENTLLTVF